MIKTMYETLCGRLMPHNRTRLHNKMAELNTRYKSQNLDNNALAVAILNTMNEVAGQELLREVLHQIMM